MAARAAVPPLQSMTGYGRGRAENAAAEAEVELRSVNGKGLSIKLRMPSERLELEPEVEERLRLGLERGSLQGSVRVRVRRQAAAELDVQVLQRYLRAWRKAEKELGLPASAPATAQLLSLPDAYRSGGEDAGTTRGVRRAVLEAGAAVLEACAAALEALRQSRQHEGARLGREMARLVKRLRTLHGRAAKRQPVARREAETRLRERLAQIWKRMESTAPVDLARELVLLAERADIQEELARLAIHLDRLDALLGGGGAIGRELEFLLQECQREVTTLGNKASDLALSELVVAMKLVVQQMREQVANVE